ncbi:unnamed protein product [Meganyctiphanes norvegica]|uniref:C2H2-type domain-containing protein n=1 Tax=Meganyctiphanes norvegica TaxID=48144 RepID=A0AAV2RVT7_MEGNR
MESPSPFQCAECKKTFTTKRAVKAHMSNVCGQKNTFNCPQCKKTYRNKKSLEHHERLKHSKLPKYSKKTHIMCSENGCTEINFPTVKSFRKHLEDNHEKVITKVTHQFSSRKDFHTWKDDIEAKIGIKYVKNNINYGANKEKSLFHCRRSGIFKPRGKGKRQLKSQGSCKTGFYCSSTIELSINNGNYEVHYFEDHSGHTLNLSDLKYTTLSQKTKHFVLDKLLNNVPKEEILNMVREDGPDDRSCFITITDIRNIRSEYKLDTL